MTVRYHQRRGRLLPTYVCQRDGISHGRRICQAVPGAGLDQRIGQLLIDTLTPLAAEAALTVQPSSSTAPTKPARCAPPTSSAPATTPTWPAAATWPSTPPTGSSPTPSKPTGTPALRALSQAQDTCEQARKNDAGQLTDAQKGPDPPAGHRPARDLERPRHPRPANASASPGCCSPTSPSPGPATPSPRTSACPQASTCTLTMAVPPTAAQLRKTPAEAVTAVDELLDRHTHAEIAGILNDRGLTSGEGRPFHRLIIRNIRDEYGLRSREQRLRDAGMLTLTEMAGRLGVPAKTVKIWHHAGLITGHPSTTKANASTRRPAPTRRPGHKGANSANDAHLPTAPAHDA
jgi:hypothetical protein